MSKQSHKRVLVSLVQELADEQQPLLITPDNLDRIIVSRLIESAPEQYPQQPFHYLLGCYNRAATEQRSLGQDAAGQQLRAVVDACKQLLVSYAGLVLIRAGVVPEVSKDTHDITSVQLCCSSVRQQRQFVVALLKHSLASTCRTSREHQGMVCGNDGHCWGRFGACADQCWGGA
jgi:hypothetical protein